MRNAMAQYMKRREARARRCLVAALVIVAWFGMAANAAAQSVLVANANGNNNASLNAALSTYFTTVDNFVLTSGTPTLEQLQAYDVVLAYSNSVPANPSGTGNVLADYVDQGGCVVLSTYAFSNPWAITGRIATAGYSPLTNEGTNGNVSGNINALAPADPIFDGVNLGAITYFHNGNFAHPGVDAGAQLLADDGADHNLIARNGSGNVLGLNLFPGEIGGNNDELYNLFANAAANCAGAVLNPNARFRVTKVFSDGSEDEVDVTLTCNSGLPLKQTFTIAGGDPDGVTFVVTDIPESGASCEVTETGTPDGYTEVFNDGNGCSWDEVRYGLRSCVITNYADPATYTVYKDWTVYRAGGDVVTAEADVTIECDSEIEGDSWEEDGTWYLSGTLSDGESLVAEVDTTEGPATCSASEEITQSGVEQSAVGCGETSLSAGGSHTCTFTNTVFFEGIPTLSQYGLAILVLLTLGVGFVGLRRFV